MKVKINTNKMGTLEEAFEILKKLTEDSGGESRIELIKVRTSQNIIMVSSLFAWVLRCYTIIWCSVLLFQNL